MWPSKGKKTMGFRIRKSISLGKGLRLNLGKSGVTGVTMGKRGAPHVTVGKGGTRFGTPVIPGTGISYETRLDKPSKKTRRKNTTMNRQQGPVPMPAGRATPMPQQAAMPTQQMPIIPPVGAMPPYAPATPPYGGGNGGNPYKAKMPWYKRWWGITIIVLLAIGVIGYIFTPSKPIPNTVGQTVSEARTTLEKAGFKTITVTPEIKGQDKKWKVEKQTPEAGQEEKTSTTITLTVKRDKAADEEAARKAEEDKKKAEEEAARKAEEEKKAAEEQARQQAEQEAQQQAADEEAARQAQQQAEQQQAQQQQPANTYYPNCTAANAAGAAPIYRGQPGYSTKLDRDGDGVACE